MKKLIVSGFAILFMISCGAHKYGIREEPNPKEHVHVFLHPRLIISGIKIDGRTKLIDEINNEYQNFDFYIPSGEQEIDVRAIYTGGPYAFSSYSKAVGINAARGDIVFVCTSIREIGSRQPTGGSVQVVVEPKLIYLKTDEEKNKALKDNKLNVNFFNESCKALNY